MKDPLFRKVLAQTEAAYDRGYTEGVWNRRQAKSTGSDISAFEKRGKDWGLLIDGSGAQSLLGSMAYHLGYGDGLHDRERRNLI